MRKRPLIINIKILLTGFLEALASCQREVQNYTKNSSWCQLFRQGLKIKSELLSGLVLNDRLENYNICSRLFNINSRWDPIKPCKYLVSFPFGIRRHKAIITFTVKRQEHGCNRRTHSYLPVVNVHIKSFFQWETNATNSIFGSSEKKE